MKIARMTKGDIEEVVRLHLRAIPWSVTTRLGYEHVRNVYEALTNQPDFFGVTCRNGEVLVGFCTCTLDYPAARHALEKVYSKRLIQILITMLAHPMDFIVLFESRFLLPSILRRVHTRSELLSLVIDQGQPRLAPAAMVALMREIKEIFRSEGVSSYISQTFAETRKRRLHLRMLYRQFDGQVISSLIANDLYVYSV